MIKNNTTDYPENKLDLLQKFHDTLFHQYDEALSGASHTLSKMKNFWEYFALAFSDSHKAFKKIKKAKNIIAYKIAVQEIVNSERK
jgi:hypothetical protein